MSVQDQSGRRSAGFAWNARFRQGLTRNSVAVYLGTLVFLFVASPFIQELRNGRIIEASVVTAMLIVAVLAVGGRRRTLITAVALVTPALAARWAYHTHPAKLTDMLAFTSFLLFVGFVVGRFLWFILRAPRVDSEVLCAAAATYLMLALLWATAYALLSRASPGAFNGLSPGSALEGYNALYFSVITLATVGYGDITPVSGLARMLTMMEAITGTMYMATLVARLVSLYSSPATPSDREGRV